MTPKVLSPHLHPKKMARTKRDMRKRRRKRRRRSRFAPVKGG